MKKSILRLCLRMYPPGCRERDGRALVDLAEELAARNRLAYARETGGLIAGGLHARCRSLRLDITGAPWHDARELLTLPLAVMLLSFFVVFGFPVSWYWPSWWTLLCLVGAACAVAGAASGRRLPAVSGSVLVFALMVFDAVVELSATHSSRWLGYVGIGEVNMVGMWLPVALLLVVCAGATNRCSTSWRRSKWWLIAVTVVGSLALRETAPYWVLWARSSLSSWTDPLGLMYIYVPLALAAATVISGVVRRHAVIKTAAAMLVIMSCLPVMWLFAMVAPSWVLVPSKYVSVLVGYYAPAIIIALALFMLLLRQRKRLPALREGSRP